MSRKIVASVAGAAALLTFSAPVAMAAPYASTGGYYGSGSCSSSGYRYTSCSNTRTCGSYQQSCSCSQYSGSCGGQSHASSSFNWVGLVTSILSLKTMLFSHGKK
ncbi:MAG: hypothetical protein Q4F67_05110 [Propionibacteriaceae bacterium]|nr:hypothetical protein [Propionibacteriaceae bacterium]